MISSYEIATLDCSDYPRIIFKRESQAYSCLLYCPQSNLYLYSSPFARLFPSNNVDDSFNLFKYFILERNYVTFDEDADFVVDYIRQLRSGHILVHKQGGTLKYA